MKIEQLQQTIKARKVEFSELTDQERINKMKEIIGRLDLDIDPHINLCAAAGRARILLTKLLKHYPVPEEEIRKNLDYLETGLFMIEHPLEYNNLRREVATNSQKKSKGQQRRSSAKAGRR